MFYRENGQFKSSYRADLALFPVAQDRWALLAFAAIAFVAVPLLASDYSFRAVLIPFLILALAAIGLNILVGYCGQISLGTGAFMAVGAYAAYNLQVRIEGMPLLVALIGGGLAPRWSGCCSAFPACASAGCTWRWPRWPRSSSWTGSPTA
jgi:branched-chain amino acid transport system permease protein